LGQEFSDRKKKLHQTKAVIRTEKIISKNNNDFDGIFVLDHPVGLFGNAPSNRNSAPANLSATL